MVHKFGYIAVVGRPNVGKSTLINELVGVKVAAVSPKPQTTRNRILGVKTLEKAQLALIDTPGIHKPINELGEYMVSEAKKSLEECDLIYHLIDSSEGIRDNDRRVVEAIEGTKTPKFCLLTKIDLIRKNSLLSMMDELGGWKIYDEIIPISAVKGSGLDDLIKTTLRYLPEGESMFPEDMVTDQPLNLAFAEIIMEKLFLYTHQEIPYSTAVEVEEINPRSNNFLYIKANIHVEKPNQRKIVIGDGGKLIKKIGSLAREEIELFTRKKIYLDLWVKVTKKWTRDRTRVKKFLYLS